MNMQLQEIEILLVEDNPNDAELTIRALKKKNMANRLFHAKDGAEALDFLFAEGEFAGKNLSAQPKIILLDLKMPKIDGLEVLKRVKGDDRTKMIPVIVLTSSKEEKDVVESYKLGVNSYIVKPVGFENFMDAVVELGMYWMVLNQPYK
jgi:two-component system, response regulator